MKESQNENEIDFRIRFRKLCLTIRVGLCPTDEKDDNNATTCCSLVLFGSVYLMCRRIAEVGPFSLMGARVSRCEFAQVPHQIYRVRFLL